MKRKSLKLPAQLDGLGVRFKSTWPVLLLGVVLFVAGLWREDLPTILLTISGVVLMAGAFKLGWIEVKG